MFGPHSPHAARRAGRYTASRMVVLLAAPFILLMAAPMLLLLLPLVLVASPLVMASMITGASSNHMESRRIGAFRPAHAAATR
jgi:hypothetical protein